LEAAIPAVIGLTDTKPVFLSKIGLVPIVGNAATAGMLRRLLGLPCGRVDRIADGVARHKFWFYRRRALL
jgi:hypothetical protein